MKAQTTLLILLALLAVLIAAGCQSNNNNDSANNPQDDDASSDDDAGDDDTSDDDASDDDADDDVDDDAADDDSGDDDTTVQTDSFSMNLTFEFRDSAVLTFEQIHDRDDIPSAQLTVTSDTDLIPSGQTLNGSGQWIRVPEGDERILAIKFNAPANSSGRCGNQPVSLVSSLAGYGQNALLVGGLAARCGQDQWTARPKQIFRMNGELAQAKK